MGRLTTPPAPLGFPLQLQDDAGRTLRLAHPPIRIVSLVPSATGILIALDQLDYLVGRTDYDTRPEVSHLPSVGGGLEPSIERIVSLRPDLVLRFRAESDLATPRQLDEAGLDHVAIRPDGISDVHRIIGLLGTITGRGEAADSIRRELADGVEQVSQRVAGADRPTVALLLGGDPPLVAGGGTFLHELIEIAGGRNVFSDLRNLYAPVNVEEVIRRDPELLLIREGAAVPGALSRFAVVRLPPEVETPGLELVESAHLIARFLHPDRFP